MRANQLKILEIFYIGKVAMGECTDDLREFVREKWTRLNRELQILKTHRLALEYRYRNGLQVLPNGPIEFD